MGILFRTPAQVAEVKKQAWPKAERILMSLEETLLGSVRICAIAAL